MAKRSNQFRTLAELNKYLQNNIPNRIMTDRNVERVLKSAMQQSVYETVYSHYVPHTYERRRQDGGLGDPRLMQITEAMMQGNAFVIIFENLAKGQDSLDGEYISKTIEEGIKEDWNNPDGPWSEARPFVEQLMRNILINPEPLIEAVKRAFVKVGFKVR